MAATSAGEPEPVEVAADLDEITSNLYAVELSAFVAERTALVKQLRTQGQRELATAVSKVRKPTLAAWALDATARAELDRIAALVEVGARLRAAQDAVLEGAPSDDLRAASDERRVLVRSLTDAAVVRVTAAGGGGDAARAEIAATFEAASLDETVAADLAGGRLSRPSPAPVGFELFGLDVAASVRPTDEPRDDHPAGLEDGDDEDAEERASARRARALARERADEARAAAAEAQEAVAAEQAELDRGLAALAHAEDAVRAARAALAEAQAAAEVARRDADDAAREADG